MIRPRAAHHLPRPVRAALSMAVVAVVVAGMLPGPGRVVASTASHLELPATGTTTPEAAGDAPGRHPSIAYEESMAHERDEIEFTPGARVTVGFTPRAGDRWPIAGKAPVALPAGRASGRDMANSPNGSRWAATDAGTKPGTAGDTHTRPGSTPDPAADPAPTPGPIDAPAGRPATPASAVSLIEPAADPGLDLAAASGLRRQVYGFLPYWELGGAASKLDYDVLSTIAYFSVGATANGNLRKKDSDGTSTTGWGGWTSSSMTRVINAAHRKGTRVVLSVSVFAWTTSQANVQRAILGSAGARMNLVRQVVAAVRDRGADGVNLDFEPLASGYADEFAALVRSFRAEFNKVKTGYQVVYDTTGFIGNYPLESSVGRSGADAVFVMGYDYRTSGSATAGSIDPLSGTGYDLADTVRAYTARISPSRVILGIPWYGRAWSTTSDAARSTNQSGAKYGYSSPVNYETVVDYVARYGRRWDSMEQSPYVAYRRRSCTSTYGCVTSWRQIYYDDAASMARRYALVNDYGLRGAGMWALGYDGGHRELYRALSEAFLVDRAAPATGIRTMPTTQPDEGFVVTWAGRDVSSVASYDVQVSRNGGPWVAWRTRTKATSEVYLGADGSGYAFRVRATDGKGHTGPWAAVPRDDAATSLRVGGFGRVVRDDLSYRAGPDTGAMRLGSLPAGTVVAVTRGPVRAHGITWFEVTAPIREWPPVSFAERGVWVAAASAGTTLIRPWHAPNATVVDAGLRDMDFGPGAATAVGTTGARSAVRAFSPNGDDSEDSLRLRWTSTRGFDRLVLNVYRANGKLVGTRSVPDTAAGRKAWDWNGQAGGARLADGRYMLQLVGTAGDKVYRAPSARPVTPAQLALYGVTVDTVAPKVSSAAITSARISPNGDGTRDRATATLAATGAVRWTARVTNATGTVVRTASGTGGAARWTWNGSSDAGRRVKDGRYAVSLLAFDTAGNPARRTWTVAVDTTGPRLTTSVSNTAFSPNGDGAMDTMVLAWTADEPATGTARLWKGTTLVRTWTISSRASWSASWDGRRANGTRVADGRYTLKVDVRDVAGNRRVATARVVVDRTARSLAWSRSFFPQDADALLATSTLSWTLSRAATTTLRLYSAAGDLVRTVWTRKAQAAGTRTWSWNGKLADGSFAPQGRYTARLVVASPYASLTLAAEVRASAFAIAPSAATARVGRTLTVTVRPIEPLSTRPRIAFTQPGRSAVTVTATKQADGSYRALFAVRSGRAGTGTIRVGAKDSGGRTNTTSVSIRVAR